MAGVDHCDAAAEVYIALTFYVPELGVQGFFDKSAGKSALATCEGFIFSCLQGFVVHMPPPDISSAVD
jgi:hypothetical protein